MNKKELRRLTKGRYVDEKCPRCSANLIRNEVGEKWCGELHCYYGITDYTKPGMAIQVSK